LTRADLRAGLVRYGPLGALTLAIAAGVALRFAYPLDIEWKTDERWSFDHAQLMLAGGGWPPIGMPTSVGAPNPGLSLWVMTGLSALFDVHSPPQLAHAVQTLNGLALIAFAFFGVFAVPAEKREPWLWAAALWALNPVAVIYERKIWPPSVLPLLTVGFLWAWWNRRTAVAAFAWGLLGALMAQIHLGVAFLALALAAWTWIHDGKGFRWLSWLAGSAAGAIPAIPWLLEMLGHGSGAAMHLRAPVAQFFLRWFTQPFGFGVDFTLGRTDMPDFLAGPTLAGHPTWAMAAAHVVLALLLLAVVVMAARRARTGGPPTARQLFLGDTPETVLITAALWGYGAALLLVSLAGSNSPRHYMIVIAPVMALWAAMAVLYGDRTPRRRAARAILVAICLCQAALSAGLLSYIDHKGVIHGEYGPTWRAQQPGYGPPAG
jgi:hypothetical protein